MAKEITVYSTQSCPYCSKMKDWLKAHKVAFNEIDVTEDNESAKQMMDESGQAGVPVLKIAENNKTKRIIIGYDTDALEEEF